MSVFNVKSFEAEAEVLGKIRKVQFLNGALAIDGLTVEQAKHILHQLSVGLTVESFESTQQHTYDTPQSPVPAKEAVQEAPTGKGTPNKQAKKEEPKSKKGTSKKKQEEESAEIEVDDEEGDDLPGDLGQDGKGPKKKEGGDVVELADRQEKKDSKGDALVERLLKYTKLIDIVEELRDNGFEEEDALIAKCEEVRDQVPVLKKINDVGMRVRRILERISA